MPLHIDGEYSQTISTELLPIVEVYQLTSEDNDIVSADTDVILPNADQPPDLPTPTTYAVTVNASPAEGGTVVGSGTYDEGESVTVKATPTSGYRFVRWVEDGTTVSTNASYTFTVEVERTLTAIFEQINTGGNSGNSSGGNSSGGHISTPSTSHSVNVPSTSNGTVSVNPKSASKGQKVTITATPDKGYVTGDVIVTDAKGNDISATKNGDGTYSFTMPSGQVTVDVKFVKAGETATSPFYDVAASAYYYNAVLWAAENGITGGYSDGSFAPNATCTRANIVTFLWRAYGSPEPTTTVNPFMDVAPDTYYCKAVLWAAENSITGGTTATTFSPNTACTRAQAVTFLYRSHGSPAVSGGASFSDVSADSYYASAVAWAAANGITTGTGADQFSPNATCSRAQIVTFLWRNMVG